MRPWLAALVLARCAGLRPMTNFGSANYGDDDFHFKKRYALIGAAAAATSVRPVRRGARFQAGMLRIGGALRSAVRHAPAHQRGARGHSNQNGASGAGPARRVRESAQLISTAFPDCCRRPGCRGWRSCGRRAGAALARDEAQSEGELGGPSLNFSGILSLSLSVPRRSARSIATTLDNRARCREGHVSGRPPIGAVRFVECAPRP